MKQFNTSPSEEFYPRSSRRDDDNKHALDISSLERENIFLRETITRLSNELLASQRPFDPTSISSKEKDEHGIILPDWIMSEEVMHPLFFAYDIRIEELGSFLDQQGSCLDVLTARINHLVEENEELRNRVATNMDNLHKSKSKSKQHAIDNDKTHKKLIEENDLLTQQSELLAKDLGCANKAIADRDKALSELNSQISGKLDLIKEKQKKMQVIRKDKAAIENLLKIRNEEIAKYKIKCRDFKQNNSEKMVEQSSLLSKLEEMTFERNQFENEAEELSQQLETSSNRIRDLTSTLAVKTHELEELTVNHTQASIELVKVKADSECIQNTIDELEHRLISSKEREDKTKMRMRESNDKLQETISIRTRLEEVCNHLQQEIDRLNKFKVEDAKKAIAHQTDALNALKAHYAVASEPQDKLVNNINIENAELKVLTDHLQNEKAKLECMNTKLEGIIEKERQMMKDQVAELTIQFSESNVKAREASRMKNEIALSKTALEHKVRRVQEALSLSKSDLIRTKDELRQLIHSSRTKEKKLNEECKLAQRLFEEEKDKWESKIQALETERASASRSNTVVLEELRNHNTHLLESLDESKKAYVEFKSKNESFISRLENDNGILCDNMDKHLLEQKKMCEQFNMKNQELMKNLSAVTDEKLQLQVLLSDKEHVCSHLSLSIEKGEERILYLERKVKECIQEQEEKRETDRDLKNNYYKLKMEVGHLLEQED